MVRSSTRDSCTNQSECRSTQEEGGATESCTNQSGVGEVTDSCRSTQEGGQYQRADHQEQKCPDTSREEEEMQGEVWDCREGKAEAKMTATTSLRSICYGTLTQGPAPC